MDVIPFILFAIMVVALIALIVFLIRRGIRFSRKGASVSAGLCWIVAILCLMGLSEIVAIPVFIQYRSDTRISLCRQNLRLIERGKSVVAHQNSLKTGDVVPEEKVNAYLQNGLPECPDGGTYTLNVADVAPSCSIHGTVEDIDTNAEKSD